MEEGQEVEVECYSGSRYAERPLAISSPGGHWRVEHILNAWRTPSGIHFRLALDDGLIHHLHYDEEEDSWWLKT